MQFYVYALFRPWDGSPFYIGKGKAERWLDHQRPSTKHTNKHLAAIVERSRKLDLEIPRVKIQEGLTEDAAFEIEKAFIAAIGRYPNGPLVNYTDGGEGTAGFLRSPEWKAKMSKIMTGRPGRRGNKLSDETKARMSEAAKKRPTHLQESLGNRTRGKPLSEEHRAKLRAAKLGKKLSEDHRKKIGAAHLGKIRSDCAKKNLSCIPRNPGTGRFMESHSE